MAARRTTSHALDRNVPPAQDPLMSSERVARVLKLATDLGEDERAELAEELWNTLPSELSPEWRAEIEQRLGQMRSAEARGEPVGRALDFDQLLDEIKTSSRQ